MESTCAALIKMSVLLESYFFLDEPIGNCRKVNEDRFVQNMRSKSMKWSGGKVHEMLLVLEDK